MKKLHEAEGTDDQRLRVICQKISVIFQCVDLLVSFVIYLGMVGKLMLRKRVIVTVIYILRKWHCNDRWFSEHFPGFLYEKLSSSEIRSICCYAILKNRFSIKVVESWQNVPGSRPETLSEMNCITSPIFQGFSLNFKLKSFLFFE